MATRGRPRVDKHQSVTRSWKIPRALYERLQAIAEREQRDTTGQVVKILQDFVDQYAAESDQPAQRALSADRQAA